MRTALPLLLITPLVCSSSVLTLASPVRAAPVPVVSYDVAETHPSGFGCWFHDYTGTIADTGRTDSVSVGCSPEANHIVNYSGGSGTLNDGVIATSTSATHLFTFRNDDSGAPIVPVITLHLGGEFLIHAIRVYGGDIDFNIFPGALTGATVEIGGISLALATSPFGTPNAIGIQPNDEINLVGTILEGIPTDRITLTNFIAAFSGFPVDQFSITEITVEGTPAVAFEGIPGQSRCRGDSIRALSTDFGGIAKAASALGFARVTDLIDAVRSFCRE